MKQIFQQNIVKAVVTGQSASQAAIEHLQRGQAIPSQLVSDSDVAKVQRLAKDIKNQMLDVPGSPYWQLRRVYRTEINLSHGLGFQASVYANPNTAGTKFILSPNHPKKDVCDMHAKVNLFGLGPGVYPKNKSPWPAHPNTLSYEQVVFLQEVTPQDKAGKQTRIDWLNAQSKTTQQSVVGRYKQQALDKGHLNENQINSSVQNLKKRHQSQGIQI